MSKKSRSNDENLSTSAKNLAKFFMFTSIVFVVMFAIPHIPTASADTSIQKIIGTFTISQDGTAKIIRSAEGVTSQHIISLTIEGNYTLSSTGLKIDTDSLSGTVSIDNEPPIILDIQKVVAYKDMKTLFYKASFVDGTGDILGKLRFSSPLNFESVYSQQASIGAITTKIDSARYYSKTPTGEISFRHSSLETAACDQSLWDHVYHPNRLKVIDPCKTVSGVIEAKISEKDGDYHIRLKLDPQYSDLINSVNTEKQHGDLVVEPICQHDVTQADAVSACEGFSGHVVIPPVGTHVKVTGTYVLDLEHGGWAEIHPVTSMERSER